LIFRLKAEATNFLEVLWLLALAVHVLLWLPALARTDSLVASGFSRKNTVKIVHILLWLPALAGRTPQKSCPTNALLNILDVLRQRTPITFSLVAVRSTPVRL
jgi:hypothetical protein